jgi:PHD/YefM family antitoxin component YafN of YafNO toxin-antitoxin module
MDFVTVRELLTTSKQTWEKLRNAGELVITNNGKPTAIILSVDESNFERTLKLIRQARTMRLLNSIWAEARERGILTDEEIDLEIAAARAGLSAPKDTKPL